MKLLFTALLVCIGLAIAGITWFFIIPLVVIVSLVCIFVYFVYMFMETEVPDDGRKHDE